MLTVSLEHDHPKLALDFQLPRGQVSAIVGPSGSGKTSVLRAVAGLLSTRSARISLEGDTWADTERGVFLPAYQRPLGFVGQRYALFPHLSAVANVAAALVHLPGAERQREAQAGLDAVGIGGLASRSLSALSGGQCQRVAMARALARKPRLLLLDEPFSALDRSTRKRLHVELKRLQAGLGMTVVLVTHDLDEAAQLSQTLCLLRRGRVLQSGSTPEVLRQPASVEAARLMDFSNLAKAEWVGADREGATLRWGELVLRAATKVVSKPGATVSWTIRSSDVFLVKDGHPDESSLGILASARATEVISMGGSVLVTVSVDHSGGEPLRMRLRPGAVHRHGVHVGCRLRIALHPEAVIVLA